jgi:hypothetical protein
MTCPHSAVPLVEALYATEEPLTAHRIAPLCPDCATEGA